MVHSTNVVHIFYEVWTLASSFVNGFFTGTAGGTSTQGTSSELRKDSFNDCLFNEDNRKEGYRPAKAIATSKKLR